MTQKNTQGTPGNDQQWEKQNPDFVEWTETGQELVFEFSHRDVINMSNGPVAKYYGARVPEGTPVSFLGSSILDQVFQAAEKGQLFKVVYTGEAKTNSGGRLNQFDIFRAK